MNTVGPYHNRQETYGYFTLPFCVGPKDSISHYHETLGEALQVLKLKSEIFIEIKSDYLTGNRVGVQWSPDRFQSRYSQNRILQSGSE